MDIVFLKHDIEVLNVRLDKILSYHEDLDSYDNCDVEKKIAHMKKVNDMTCEELKRINQTLDKYTK